MPSLGTFTVSVDVEQAGAMPVRLESCFTVWDNERGWVQLQPSDGQCEPKKPQHACSFPMQGDAEPGALAVRAELLRELDHHPCPASDFPSSKRRCFEGVWTRSAPMSIVLAHDEDEGACLASAARELEDMDLEEACGLVPARALLGAHAARTHVLFPADRLGSFRAAALARGAVAV